MKAKNETSLVKVKATIDFFCGGEQTPVISKGDERKIELNIKNNSFFTRTNDGSYFGMCNINDGWELIPETHYYTINPPSGWLYGFPKSVTETEFKSITNFKQWCIDNGYPEKEANDLGEYFNIQISGPIPCVYVEQKTIEKVNRISMEKQADLIETEFALKANQKQYKQFDETLFKAYINKFSNEDKMKALKVLVCDISTTDPKLNTLLNQISNF